MDFITSEAIFKFTNTWIQELFNKLLEVQRNKSMELNKIGDVFGDPLQLAKYYVEPDCQQFNPTDFDDEDSSIVREQIFKRFGTFLGGNVREGKHQLFVLSDAGMGKTSLLVMLKLANITSLWPKGYECILVKLGRNSLSEISKIKDRKEKVLLLDALDEDPHAWGRVTERIIEILRETYNFRRVVITCRTQFFSAGEDPFNRRGQVEIGGFLCPVIYNSLFTELQTEEYLKKRFANRKESKKFVKKAKGILKNMNSLKFRPMLLSHIEDFLEESQNNWNEYTIYETLLKAWLYREQRKPNKRNEQLSSIDELWKACRIFACYLQKHGLREMTENKLHNLIETESSLKHIPKMDIKGRSLLNKNSRGDFRFSHYSIQEFLLVNSSIKKEINLKVENIVPTPLMNSFIVAWLKSKPEEANLTDILKHYDLSGANFARANLSNLKLHSVVMQNANLSNAIIQNTELKWSNLENCNLCGTNFSKSKLFWTSVKGALYDDNTVWPIGFDYKDAIKKIST